MKDDFKFISYFSSIDGYYITSVILYALLIRIILSVINSFFHSNSQKVNNYFVQRNFIRLSFLSNSRDPSIDDYWLPFFVGWAELFTFPFIFNCGSKEIIGGWLVFKAIGSWQTNNQRTAINKFIFGNILVLVSSYFLWYCFISKIKC